MEVPDPLVIFDIRQKMLHDIGIHLAEVMAPLLADFRSRPQQLTSQERALYGRLIALAVQADIGDAQEHALALRQ